MSGDNSTMILAVCGLSASAVLASSMVGAGLWFAGTLCDWLPDQKWACRTTSTPVKTTIVPGTTTIVPHTNDLANAPDTKKYNGKSGTAAGTAYNIYSDDNTCAGCLNQWKVPKGFPVNIVAVHERDWDAYKYKTVNVTYKGKSGQFIVGDYCADKDCDGCCTKNAAKYGKPKPFLLDLDSRAVTKIWGIKKPENSFMAAVQYKFGPAVDARKLWPKMGAKYGG